MPERALLRLKRTGIPLYKVRKTQKNALIFQVNGKDIEKVFAIYPNVCYNIEKQTPYKIEKLGGVGFAKVLEFCKNRVGILLGALAFASVALAADSMVFGVELSGNTAYEREILLALAESGVKPFARYPKGKEDTVTAKILSLKGVEFCSVKKVGNRVRVETRVSPFPERRLQTESMCSAYTGTLLSITVLQGCALKQAGDRVQAGDALVGNYLPVEEGALQVAPIARVRIACTYESWHEGSEKEAFAGAYLALNLQEGDQIAQKSLTPSGEGYEVKIEYTVTQRVNL